MNEHDDKKHNISNTVLVWYFFKFCKILHTQMPIFSWDCFNSCTCKYFMYTLCTKIIYLAWIWEINFCLETCRHFSLWNERDASLGKRRVYSSKQCLQGNISV